MISTKIMITNFRYELSTFDVLQQISDQRYFQKLRNKKILKY